MADLETYRTLGLEHGLDKEMPDSERIDNYYLLVIAIDDYGGNFPKLSNAVRDANNVVEVLTKEYRFGPEQDNNDGVSFLNDTDPNYQLHEKRIPVYADKDLRRTCLYNAAATTTAISQKIDEIIAIIGKNDALLIYFAGHGVYKHSRYHLLCANSLPGDRASWLMLDNIFTPFDDYTTTSRCKDLLLIVDACYAGGATLSMGQMEAKPYSRYILSSALHDQKASDGIPQRGSAFAEALVKYLHQNSFPYLNLTDGRSKLISLFDNLQQNQAKKQSLIIGAMPGNNGDSFFIFEKREKYKPKPSYLKESFLEYLDFEKHRSSLTDQYSDNLNHLNIISTHGYSTNMQYLASKITFRWIKELDTGKLVFDASCCFKASNVKIDAGNESIWSTLYRELKNEKDKLQDNKESISKYLFKKLEPAEDKYSGKCHVILWLSFSNCGKELFGKIDKFCAELSTLFIKKLESISEEEKQKLGKIFLFFLDERKGAKKFQKTDFKELVGSTQFNLLPLDTCPEEVNENHVKKWIKQTVIGNQSRKIQEMTWDKVKEQLKDVVATVPGTNMLNYKYEVFVKKISEYCEYNQTEIDELINQLFLDFEYSLT